MLRQENRMGWREIQISHPIDGRLYIICNPTRTGACFNVIDLAAIKYNEGACYLMSKTEILETFRVCWDDLLWIMEKETKNV